MRQVAENDPSFFLRLFLLRLHHHHQLNAVVVFHCFDFASSFFSCINCALREAKRVAHLNSTLNFDECEINFEEKMCVCMLGLYAALLFILLFNLYWIGCQMESSQKGDRLSAKTQFWFHYV